MEVYVPSAKETCRFYDKAQMPSPVLKAIIEALWFKVFLHLYACMLTHRKTSHSFLAFSF